VPPSLRLGSYCGDDSSQRGRAFAGALFVDQRVGKLRLVPLGRHGQRRVCGRPHALRGSPYGWEGIEVYAMSGRGSARCSPCRGRL
jgi:hypothetical protein